MESVALTIVEVAKLLCAFTPLKETIDAGTDDCITKSKSINRVDEIVAQWGPAAAIAPSAGVWVQ